MVKHGQTLAALRGTLPHAGRVEWIGVRPARRVPVRRLEQVFADVQDGLSDDHYGSRSRRRQVTLIQAEHLPAIARFVRRSQVEPELLRRNLVVSGINLLALRDRTIAVGNARLCITGQCHPCSLMEELLGEGGYNAVRGHGGVTARIVVSGMIALGDTVAPTTAGGNPTEDPVMD